jgi:steroid 5-alpha reductase family enzyme
MISRTQGFWGSGMGVKTMTTVTLVCMNLGAVFVFMTGIWVVSVLKKKVSIVDGFWGLGFVLVTWLTFALSSGYAGRKLLIAVLITLWGVRLAAHIFYRSWGEPEDKRYRAWRQEHGDRYWYVSFVTVFMLQGVLLWLVSLASQIGQLAPTPAHFTWWDGCGFGVWAFGWLFETIGDWQLLQFKKQPANAGKIMDQGLWAYTRHPNYFGEMVAWWGLFIIALATPGGFWFIFSPLLLTGLLLKVSGVALLDKTMLTTRPQYREYMARTSAFFPWFPKKPQP